MAQMDRSVGSTSRCFLDRRGRRCAPMSPPPGTQTTLALLQHPCSPTLGPADGFAANRVRVVGSDLLDIFAEGQHLWDIALAIHNATGAERVADALVDAVFERDIDIEREGVEAADTRGVEHVVGTF